MISISRQDILTSHILVAKTLDSEVGLKDPKVLKELENQLATNLQWMESLQVAAYVGLQIFRRKPFVSGNQATAIALTIAIARLQGVTVKADKAIELLKNSFSRTTIVDDIVQDLQLVCE